MNDTLPHLPYELWEQILDLLDTQGLLSFQKVCTDWREIVVSYVMDGRLKSRALSPFHLPANEWWEVVMNITPERKSYCPMSSGFIWSTLGAAGATEVTVSGGLKVQFKATEGREYPWRTSQTEGQLPYFLLWPLL